MPLMSSELYDALLEAGASEEKARKAAESVASFEHRFASLEGKITLLTWMVSSNVVLTLGVLWKLLS